jgi:hypothetical protein
LTTTSYEAVMCKIKINTIFPIIILHCLIFITKVSANNEFCYTSSGVFGIIIASVVITLVVIGLTLATLWFLWTKNRLKLGKKLNYLLYKEHNFEKPVKREVFLCFNSIISYLFKPSTATVFYLYNLYNLYYNTCNIASNLFFCIIHPILR